MRLARRGRASAIRRDRLLSLIGFVAVWWLASRLAASASMAPAPERVLLFAWQQIVTGELPRQFAVTLARVVVAFVLAMAGGALVGYLAGRSRRADALIDPWLVIALNLPLLVVVILAYIWVGLNETAAVLAVVVAKAPAVAVTVREGARALDPGLDDVARVFRLPRWRRLRRIVLPQLFPYLVAAGRGGLSIVWKIVLVVELIGRPDGVGFALNLFFQNFNVTGILAYGLVFAALMLLVEMVLLQPIERRANAWRRDA